MKKLLVVISFLSVIFSFLLVSFANSEEQLSIITYYPSPYGSYKDLSVSNTVNVRGGAVPATLDLGVWAVSTTALGAGKTANIAVYATNGVNQAALAETWSAGGVVSSSGVVGTGPTNGGVSNQWAGYFLGDVYISGKIMGSGICTRFAYTTTSGYQACPAGTYITLNPLTSAVPPGYFLCCPCAGC